jgi:RHS repeat-associated protein
LSVPTRAQPTRSALTRLVARLRIAAGIVGLLPPLAEAVPISSRQLATAPASPLPQLAPATAMPISGETLAPMLFVAPLDAGCSRALVAVVVVPTQALSDLLANGELAGKYHRARWMDPRLGRFTSTDRLGPNPLRPTTINRYRYSGNDPVDQRDPSGLFECVATLSIAMGSYQSLASWSSSLNFQSYGDSVQYYALTDKVVADPQRGFYKDHAALIRARAADTRLLVVQWVQGYYKVDDHFGRVLRHQGVDNVEMNWPTFTIDAEWRQPEYTSYAMRKAPDHIDMWDYPGTRGELLFGTSFEANLHFKVAIYDKLKYGSLPFESFSIDTLQPPPLVQPATWDFVGSYQVP